MNTKHTQLKTSNSSRIWKGLSLLLVVVTLIGTSMLIASCGDDDDPKAPELSITSISPNTGGEGTEVSIRGTGFSATASANTVTLNSKPCPIVSASETQLKVTIPADAGSGNIQVTVGGKTVQSSLFTFVEEVVLAITSITPTSGPKATVVTITGTGFSTTAANNTVTINGKTCTVNSATATQLMVVIPPAAGSGPIQVTVEGENVQSADFTFVYTATVGTLAGSSSGYTDATGTAAQFSSPMGVAVDGEGNVYVSDHNNHKIRKITPQGVVTTLAGSAQGDALGTGSEAQFNYPYYLDTDAAGNVYVVDTHNHKIKKITPDGTVSLLAGSTGGYADGTGSEAQFYYPTGIDVDADGNVYVADKDSHKIRKITPNGVVSTLAGSTAGTTDGTGAAAQFNGPVNVAVDGNGNVYVTDGNVHLIRKITPAGEVTTVAGSTQGSANGTGSAAQFNYPYSLAIDATGDLLIADTFNHKIRRLTQAGVVSTFLGTTGGYADGSASTAQFNYPTDVAVAADGRLYFADKDNHKIRVVTFD